MVKVFEYALFGTFCIGLMTFIFRFYLSDWRINIVGKYMMYFLVTISVLFIYIFLAPLFGDHPSREIFNVLLLLSLNFGAWKITWLIFNIERGNVVNTPKLFGREPTLYIALITALVSWGVGFGWDGLTAENAAWISAAINAVAGCAAAYLTRPIAPQAFTYGVTTVFGLLGSYGLHLSQEMLSSTQFLVLTMLALITRGAVSPKDDAPHTGVLGNKPQN